MPVTIKLGGHGHDRFAELTHAPSPETNEPALSGGFGRIRIRCSDYQRQNYQRQSYQR